MGEREREIKRGGRYFIQENLNYSRIVCVRNKVEQRDREKEIERGSKQWIRFSFDGRVQEAHNIFS